jgi:hypothetical protein
LTESPHLAPLIRELYVMNSPSPHYSYLDERVDVDTVVEMKQWIDLEANFLLLFSMLPNLQHLSLSSYYDLNWDTLSEDFQEALLNVLGSIPNLKLSMIKNFPLGQFKNFYQLKNLILRYFTVDSNRSISTVVAPRRGHLEFFEFDESSQTGVEQLVQELLHSTSSLTISRLRQLSIPGISPGMLAIASKVIEASSRSLEDLSLIINKGSFLMGMCGHIIYVRPLTFPWHRTL